MECPSVRRGAVLAQSSTPTVRAVIASERHRCVAPRHRSFDLCARHPEARSQNFPNSCAHSAAATSQGVKADLAEPTFDKRVDVCFYQELDPMSGSIPQERASLDRLIKQLRFACLFYDAVILPPNCLIEHALALPAFEDLRPFVQAGVLGSSVDPTQGSPMDVIGGRIQQTLRAEPEASGGSNLSRWHVQEINALDRRLSFLDLRGIKGRWGDLLPGTWPIERDVDVQVSGFVDTIRKILSPEREPMNGFATSASWLLDFIKNAEDQGCKLVHTLFLAKLATWKGAIPDTELAALLTLVQTIYLKQGILQRCRKPRDGAAPAGAHEREVRVRLYAGRFARCTQGMAGLWSALLRVPYDWAATPRLVRARLQRLGFDLLSLLAHPIETLFALANDPVWRLHRTLLMRADSEEAARRILVPVLRSVLRRQLLRVRDCQPLLPSAIVPGPWLLAAQAGLGTLALVARRTDEVLFDWALLRLVKQSTGHYRDLSAAQAQLLLILASSGDVGLSWSELDRSLIEHDALPQTPSLVPHLPEKEGNAWDAREVMKRRRHDLDIIKAELRPILWEFSMAVDVRRGRWRLLSRWPLRLSRSLWTADGLREPLAPPPYLHGQQADAFAILAAHYAAPVSVKAVAFAIGKTLRHADLTYTAKLLYKLANRLTKQHERCCLQRPRRGYYCLIDTKM